MSKVSFEKLYNIVKGHYLYKSSPNAPQTNVKFQLTIVFEQLGSDSNAASYSRIARRSDISTYQQMRLYSKQIEGSTRNFLFRFFRVMMSIEHKSVYWPSELKKQHIIVMYELGDDMMISCNVCFSTIIFYDLVFMFLVLLTRVLVFVLDSVILQKKYPNHYLWISEIFSTSLYQEFEAQLSGAIGESTKKFQVSDCIQVVASEIAAAISVGLETRNVLVEIFLQALFCLCNDPSQIRKCLENVLQTQSPTSSGHTAPSVPSVTSASLGPSVPSAPFALSSFTQVTNPDNNEEILPYYKMSQKILPVTDM
ncbi:hypothetical protein PHYBLDRAFT_174828 [Phycomyces blakesleeanus NRRL 1555(-)]|uniref:Uncharacterized protein n=1 Tax=Phycomyces blakesleeanus (strain ATCC 8743b / DSM 1359 / FGSC 10004 / NBRC 33097 / NRRL 1555) TaxID=763407 RepID=A0A162T7W2_PHYB8|nr:hypothetical protein PHYBLDRAFT_174828 [Phycomyces blakesleeanus NRRL 1555(-)]OAD66802.1 hypothetical protein PHYBLDRAFT_174828 [Phycomyces blakesleeanus NRRL 1555(-)]|eukprot:XP_018284842.1 hypothetical protein PHYBLDRAFT_174828 [Phycomyces blakesleeanus NRRL 1555(-)]